MKKTEDLQIQIVVCYLDVKIVWILKYSIIDMYLQKVQKSTLSAFDEKRCCKKIECVPWEWSITNMKKPERLKKYWVQKV